MAPTTISDNLFADSLINRGYNVEKVISYKRKKEIIEKEDADIIIFQKKILPGHKYQDIYKLKGKVFLCHIDDDFEGMNEEVYKKTLEISDLILVGNKAHAKNLSNYINTPVEVIVAISDFENGNVDMESPIVLLEILNQEIYLGLKKYFEENDVNYIDAKVGCTVGIHSGIKACGIFFIEK
jgi:hypothetical protein